MKTRILALFCLLTLLAGCSTTATDPSSINPIVVRLGVSTGVTYGLSKYPQAVPGVRIAGEVICSAATGTNLSPDNLIAAIQGVSTNITPETTLIVNGALVLYIGIWNSYGQSALTNQPALRLYLQATCSGILDGLASSGRRVPESAAQTWPLLRSK